MTKLVLLTKDDTLRDELSGAVVGSNSLAKKLPSSGGSIVFYDIDTLVSKGIEHICDKCLVVAVTKQKSTEPACGGIVGGQHHFVQRVNQDTVKIKYQHGFYTACHNYVPKYGFAA